MAANHNQFVLDQRTQKRNKLHDSAPFICYDGDNIVVVQKKGEVAKQKTFSVRCWTGMGLVIYAGNGMIQVRGYSECMDRDATMAFDDVLKKAFLFNFPEG